MRKTLGSPSYSLQLRRAYSKRHVDFTRLHLSTLFALAKPLPCFPDPFPFVILPTLNVFSSIWTRSSFVVDESAFSGCNV